MDGAREYAILFETGQYGRFYISSGSHARGRTFQIEILPEDEEAISNGVGNKCRNADAVEVYGIISGQPGWTEKYGWLHKGRWVDDFNKMVEDRKKEIASIALRNAEAEAEKLNAEERRIRALLAAY